MVMRLNYYGNHEFLTDPEVRLPHGWFQNEKDKGITEHKAVEALRGRHRRTDCRTPFPVDMILSRGYAFMTACYADVSPDRAEHPRRLAVGIAVEDDEVAAALHRLPAPDGAQQRNPTMGYSFCGKKDHLLSEQPLRSPAPHDPPAARKRPGREAGVEVHSQRLPDMS